MEHDSTRTDAGSTAVFAAEAWFEPIEAGLRERVRGFIEELLEQELTAALGRSRHERLAGEPKSYGTGRVSVSSWAASARWRSAYHGRAWPMPTAAAHGSGVARRCRAAPG